MLRFMLFSTDEVQITPSFTLISIVVNKKIFQILNGIRNSKKYENVKFYLKYTSWLMHFQLFWYSEISDEKQKRGAKCWLSFWQEDLTASKWRFVIFDLFKSWKIKFNFTFHGKEILHIACWFNAKFINFTLISLKRMRRFDAIPSRYWVDLWIL